MPSDPNPAIVIAALTARVEALEAILAELYLYVDWKFCTEPLRTSQKDLWADVVHDWLVKTMEPDDKLATSPDRWWQK